MKARDYFEELVLVEHDLRRAREMLDVAEDRVDGVGGSAPLPTRSGGASPDGVLGRLMAVDRAKRRWADRLDELCAREDEAWEVIAAVRPPNPRAAASWRSCLQERYLMCKSYAEVSEAVGMSVSGVRYSIDSALDWIDAQGGPLALIRVGCV